MEWKKVKTILLCVLICTNVFLAGNIWLQIGQNRSEQKTAFRLALNMLNETVGDFDREVFDDVKKRSVSYYVMRDQAIESNIAKTLISSDSIGTAGGGIHFFTSSAGKATFRNGGAIEILWKTDAQAGGSDFFIETLEKAGLNMRSALVETKGDTTIISQKLNGENIENAKLACDYKNGKCTVSGRWVQGAPLERAGCKTGHEMVIALNDYCIQNEIKTAPSKIEIVYFADGNDDGETILTPAWKISNENTHFYLNCETGKERVFEDNLTQK